MLNLEVEKILNKLSAFAGNVKEADFTRLVLTRHLPTDASPSAAYAFFDGQQFLCVGNLINGTLLICDMKPEDIIGVAWCKEGQSFVEYVKEQMWNKEVGPDTKVPDTKVPDTKVPEPRSLMPDPKVVAEMDKVMKPK